MYLFIPSSINLGALRHSDFYRHSEKYYYLIFLLYHIRIRDKRFNDDDFIPLNGKFLANVLGGKYKKYLNDLIDLDIVETDNYYIPGIKSKGYRLKKKYRNVEHKRVKIIKKDFMEKITRSYKQHLDLPHYEYMEQCVKKVSLLYDEALSFVYNNATSSGYFNEDYISNLYAVDMLTNPDTIYFIPDLTAGRIHTNITNLSKDLRQFLRYENEQLFEVDIANSQPFLFNLLINQYLNSYSIKSNYLSYGNQNTTCYPDIELYRNLTSNGMFYEYVMDKLNIKESRSEFKIRFFAKVFYSKENPNYVHEERKQFQKLFPNVAEIIAYYKNPDYRQLAITLQRKESDIMIKGVAKKLSEMNIYFLTIHDSILTTKENVCKVKRVILSEFKERYSLIPTIRDK